MLELARQFAEERLRPTAEARDRDEDTFDDTAQLVSRHGGKGRKKPPEEPETYDTRVFPRKIRSGIFEQDDEQGLSFQRMSPQEKLEKVAEIST
ncbi:MAG: hypothetical protein R3266_08830, partial [Gemmatimonadota bacterium]|nr:hypothetical protein [Gemmatimonadota bacterium]